VERHARTAKIQRYGYDVRKNDGTRLHVGGPKTRRGVMVKRKRKETRWDLSGYLEVKPRLRLPSIRVYVIRYGDK